jgi:hypothetical protein
VNPFLHRIVNWLRVGYPQGIPPTDYMPLLALLSRRLTNDEVETVAKELMDRGEFDNVDIGVAITQITDDSPSPDDVQRSGRGSRPRGGRLTTHPIARRTDSDAALVWRSGLNGTTLMFHRSSEVHRTPSMQSFGTSVRA